MSKAIFDRLELARQNRHPQAIARLPSGWVMLGDVQPLKGYCILFADPIVESFNHLEEPKRAQYGIDIARVGDALLKVTGAYRINYETWGNLDPALHTHIVPRFQSEPQNLRVLPPRQAYDWGGARPFNAEMDGALVLELRDFLKPFAVSAR
jgi:diadenosine tetraphosphate (Ap4A) HIT family hydrolase